MTDALTKYRKKSGQTVIAVQLNLETDGFKYQKWGDQQTCKAGDWILKNNGECYTVDRETFARTYDEVAGGVFEKTTSVWARVTKVKGVIRTKEGLTHYGGGDYLVFNEEDGGDGYAMSPEKFDAMYTLFDD